MRRAVRYAGLQAEQASHDPSGPSYGPRSQTGYTPNGGFRDRVGSGRLILLVVGFADERS